MYIIWAIFLSPHNKKEHRQIHAGVQMMSLSFLFDIFI